jgi:FkbM family methyltransferase
VNEINVNGLLNPAQAAHVSAMAILGRDAKAPATDLLGRFREIVSDPLNLLIERGPRAGMVEDGLVCLHNGNRVPIEGPNSYYGRFSDILAINRGVHEPLEEFVFQEVLRVVPEDPVMLELGSYWGHYSMWMKCRRPGARVFMVEPEPQNLEVGRSNFARHGYDGTFIRAFVGRGQFEIDCWAHEHDYPQISVLHADIQGFEVEMLGGCAESLSRGLIDYVFVSTHGQDIHDVVVGRLAACGIRVEVSSGFDFDATSFDGFVFGSRHGLSPVFSGFRPIGRCDLMQCVPAQLVSYLVATSRTWPSVPTSPRVAIMSTSNDKIALNVALNRSAIQSSTCEWSKPDDASRAVSGSKTGSYAFCTGAEVAPWWMLDLGSSFAIRDLVIFNRDDGLQDRAFPLSVEVSQDKNQWSKIADVNYPFGGRANGRPLQILPTIPILGRFIRLTRQEGPEHFHLDQVEVYVDLETIPQHSQLRQDLWVVAMTGGRRGGTFFEIGASDGVSNSNTLLLEDKFGWSGTCVECNPILFEQLAARRLAHCVCTAIYPQSGLRLKFAPAGELGTIHEYESGDFHAAARQAFLKKNAYIEVETTNPNELLNHQSMPQIIDYLSIDTEGGEWDILRSIDFARRAFGLLTIEHNFVEDKRRLVCDHLTNLGYHRIPANFDDWYYHPPILNLLNGATNVDFASVNRRFADAL